ncbi:MAG: hypothetical protein AAF642_03420 [Pseudomonadota bacterium]
MVRLLNWSRFCKYICVSLFGLGAIIHALDILRAGVLPYTFAPYWINVFWTSLLPLDLIAAFALWSGKPIGIYLALAIMLADVCINTYAHNLLGISQIHWGYVVQVAFLGFLVAYAWPYLQIAKLDHSER